MTIITTTCRRCGAEFEPGREAIVVGAWRLCPGCRDVAPSGPVVYPQCHRVLKSGKHRGPCPGRRRTRSDRGGRMMTNDDRGASGRLALIESGARDQR
jgi:hypothetical protein